jgi:PPOX class probable F420-dependent enzyme
MFQPEVAELLSTRVPAVFTTLLPDGSPHSVVAGVWADGDQLVTNTVPTAKRLENLRADPRVNVVVIDPSSPMRYVEIRGTAAIRESTPEEVAALLEKHAAERGGAAPDAQERPEVTVLQVRVTPTKVNYQKFNPATLGPEARQRAAAARVPQDAAAAVTSPDGIIRDDEEGRWIEFQRQPGHSAEAVWAALTEPRRLVLWQHPVEFFPDLREGATVYAHLNPEAKAFALGKVTVLRPPHALAFRWTTTHPMLSPDVTLSYTFENGTLRIRYGPFGKEDAVIPMAASLHIHLDHLDLAVTTPDSQLPDPPWPQPSVVTKSGQMRPTIGAYAAKYPELMKGPEGRPAAAGA